MTEINYLFIEVAQKVCGNLGYEFIAPKGKGAFKETYHIRENGVDIALKIIDPDKNDLKRLEREINSLILCDSSFICKLHKVDIININHKNYYYIIEQYLDGGNLTNKITSPLSIDEVKIIGFSILNAIKCLKNNGLVHRDIKPDNIMFNAESKYPLLVDFGLVRDLSATSLTQSWIMRGPGTPYFSSPEQLNNEKYLIDWKSDQFSLGIVLGICLTGRHPYSLPDMSPDEVVSYVAERRKVQNWFIEEMEKISFQPILKMVEAWPIRRYIDIEQLINDLKT